MAAKTCIYLLITASILTACGQSNSHNTDTDGSTKVATTTNEHASTSQTSVQNATNTTNSSIVNAAKTAKDGITTLGDKAQQIHDVAVIAQAVKRSGVQLDDAKKWQTQLEQATSEQAAKQVLKEQLDTSNRLLSEMSKVQPRSQEGKHIIWQLNHGTQKTQQALRQLLALDFTDPDLNQKLAPIMQQAYEGGQLNFAAIDAFLQLAKELGFNSNEEAIQTYQQQKHMFEAATQNYQ